MTKRWTLLLAFILCAGAPFSLDLEELRMVLPGDQSGKNSAAMKEFSTDFPVNEDQYIIGPGDLFEIFIEEFVIQKPVNIEGNVIFSEVGIIPVNGLTLKEAKALILKRVEEKSIRKQCFVNLGKPKAMRVFVTGAVRQPGVYEVQGNQRLTEALSLAGGLSDWADEMSIRIKTGDSVESIVNLNDFLYGGRLETNPYLLQGAIVHVPFLDLNRSFVTVIQDSIYRNVQIEKDVTIKDILMRVNSPLSPPYYNGVKITEKGSSPKHISSLQAETYIPKAGALLEVLFPKMEVFVGGAVQSPGFYFYNPEFRILQYVSKAGINTDTKLSKSVQVIRVNGDVQNVDAAEGTLNPGDAVIVKENFQKKLLLYTPIIMSLASLTLAIVTLTR